MAKFEISEQIKRMLVVLNNQSVVSNSVKNHILSHCSVIASRDGVLDLEQIKELRSFIAKSIVDSENVAVGLWHKNINDVFVLLKSLDKAIFDDGDENIIIKNSWEE
jgi:hypothetical protein